MLWPNMLLNTGLYIQCSILSQTMPNLCVSPFRILLQNDIFLISYWHIVTKLGKFLWHNDMKGLHPLQFCSPHSTFEMQ